MLLPVEFYDVFFVLLRFGGEMELGLFGIFEIVNLWNLILNGEIDWLDENENGEIYIILFEYLCGDIDAQKSSKAIFSFLSLCVNDNNIWFRNYIHGGSENIQFEFCKDRPADGF